MVFSIQAHPWSTNALIYCYLHGHILQKFLSKGRERSAERMLSKNNNNRSPQAQMRDRRKRSLFANESDSSTDSEEGVCLSQFFDSSAALFCNSLFGCYLFGADQCIFIHFSFAYDSFASILLVLRIQWRRWTSSTKTVQGIHPPFTPGFKMTSSSPSLP